MFDFDNHWFAPLWIRLLVTAITLGWGAFEFLTGSPGWGILFLATGIYVAYRLFITFDPKE